MNIRPIRTEAEYKMALAQINTNFDALEGTDEADVLDILVVLVEDWESRHYPVALPHPVAAIEFALEQKGRGREALLPLLRTPARISEVLGGQRRLTLRMIRWLHTTLDIPLAVLTQEYPAQPTRPARGRPLRPTPSARPIAAVG